MDIFERQRVKREQARMERKAKVQAEKQLAIDTWDSSPELRLTYIKVKFISGVDEWFADDENLKALRELHTLSFLRCALYEYGSSKRPKVVTLRSDLVCCVSEGTHKCVLLDSGPYEIYSGE